MSPVVRRVGIAFLQFLSGTALLYLAYRLSVHNPVADGWVEGLFEASTFGRDWWALVLTGLGAALVLLGLPSPWRGDRPAPAKPIAVIVPTYEVQSSRRFADAPFIETPNLPEPAAQSAVSPVLKPTVSTPSFTPSFRSKPSPPRPLRKLVVTRESSLVEE